MGPFARRQSAMPPLRLALPTEEVVLSLRARGESSLESCENGVTSAADVLVLGDCPRGGAQNPHYGGVSGIQLGLKALLIRRNVRLNRRMAPGGHSGNLRGGCNSDHPVKWTSGHVPYSRPYLRPKLNQRGGPLVALTAGAIHLPRKTSPVPTGRGQ